MPPFAATLLLALLPLAAAAAPSEVRIDNASARYDFVALLPDGACAGAQDECTAQVALEVHRKGEAAALQTLADQTLLLLAGDDGALHVNDSELYGLQGSLNTGDFNFDGEEDFAVRNGNDGSYGGPSYDVYLYSPARRRFEHNQALTGLILETLGFFQVDAARKRLATSAKSGCCYHAYTEYAMDGDTPTPVYERIEDALAGAADGWMTVTEKTWRKGRWHERSRRVRIDAYYRD